MHLVMADQGGNSVLRDYRKGNWTIQETMVLIEGKKMDDERRMKRSVESEAGGGRSKPAELRWKWVEDYCWRKGCFRSQNQCNDKWDNLMRDYKRVRDYERRRLDLGNHEEEGSYWKIEKNERKVKNLPSNMLPLVYDALVEVVERKGSSSSAAAAAAQSVMGGGGCGSNSNNPNNNMGFLVEVERPINVVQPPPLLQHHISAPMQALPLPPPPPPTTAAPPPPSQPLPTTMCDSSDSDTSGYSDSPAKRRRKGGEGTSGGGGGGGGGGTDTTASASTTNEVGSAISKSASIIAQAFQASEEREEKRHKELLNLHERRLKIEESKAEINRQGINGLVDAINKLANSILALASHKNNQTPPPK